MPKQKIGDLTDFGKRLMTLRKKTGYTQVELAKELGITPTYDFLLRRPYRVPSSTLLPKLAKLLSVTTDELLGIKSTKRAKQPDTRLLRRFQQVDKLGSKEKRQVIQLLDTLY